MCSRGGSCFLNVYRLPIYRKCGSDGTHREVVEFAPSNKRKLRTDGRQNIYGGREINAHMSGMSTVGNGGDADDEDAAADDVVLMMRSL